MEIHQQDLKQKSLNNLLPKDAEESRFCRKILFWTLAVWGIFWTLVPLILIEGFFFDVLENLEWGRYWQFGYDKHPFVSMWITRMVYELTGSPAWLYLLNQISVILTVVCVWRLALRILRPLPALASALMLLSLQFFSSWALEFNNDVIAISVWAAAMLCCYRAVTEQKLADWCLTAFFCFLAVMTKYSAVLLIGLLGLAVLGHRTGRVSFRHAGIYCAAGLFLLLVLPNILWLIRNDFLPFDYAMHGSSHGQNPGIIRNLAATADYFLSCVLERLICFILFILVLFTKRERPENRIRTEGFDRFYITLAALGPLVITLLLPLLGGIYIKMAWMASCFNFLAVYFFMVSNPVVSRRKILLLLILLGIYAAGLAVYESYSVLWDQPYCSRKCNYQVYPGKAIAEKAEQLWSAHVPRGMPLKFVISSRQEACSFSYYASTHPRSCFLYDFRISPWCSPDELKQSGALVLWEKKPLRGGGFSDERPDWFGRLPKNDLIIIGEFDFERLVRPWFRSCIRKPVRQTRIVFAILPPSAPQRVSAP